MEYNESPKRFRLLPSNFCIDSSLSHDLEDFDEAEMEFACRQLQFKYFKRKIFHWKASSNIGWDYEAERARTAELDFYFDENGLKVFISSNNLRKEKKGRKIIVKEPIITEVVLPIPSRPFKKYAPSRVKLYKRDIVEFMPPFLQYRISGNNELEVDFKRRFFSHQSDVVIFIDSYWKYLREFFELNDGNGIVLGHNSFRKIVKPYFLLTKADIKWINTGDWQDKWHRKLYGDIDDNPDDDNYWEPGVNYI